MSPWSRARSSCESQLRRGKPLSAPLQTCTKRTPRSSSRRAIRQLRPKSSRHLVVEAVAAAASRPSPSRGRAPPGRDSCKPGGQLVGGDAGVEAASRPGARRACLRLSLRQQVQAVGLALRRRLRLVGREQVGDGVLRRRAGPSCPGGRRAGSRRPSWPGRWGRSRGCRAGRRTSAGCRSGCPGRS